jgi:hypothetical protein
MRGRLATRFPCHCWRGPCHCTSSLVRTACLFAQFAPALLVRWSTHPVASSTDCQASSPAVAATLNHCLSLLRASTARFPCCPHATPRLARRWDASPPASRACHAVCSNTDVIIQEDVACQQGWGNGLGFARAADLGARSVALCWACAATSPQVPLHDRCRQPATHLVKHRPCTSLS